MNYKKIYDNLIHRGKNRILESYTERHHIIPRCLGGGDEIDNLVDLTPEEHYLAHQLLVKIYPNNHSLAKAAMMMTAQRPSNKVYGWLRRRVGKAMSDRQLGEGNSQYGTRWIHNIELKENKKISSNELLPVGWKEGRKINFDKPFHECDYCGKSFIQRTKELFCCSKCKIYKRSPVYKIIDDNIETILQDIIECHSISVALRKNGVTGNKIGNTYVSNIAKKRGIKILRRRNSPD